MNSKDGVDQTQMASRAFAGSGVIEQYGELLQLGASVPHVNLGEGNTPLIRAKSLEHRTGAAAVYLKLESCNPTGSFKDRGMVIAVAKAIDRGKTAVICASTGNTSASAAAYAAHCGLQAYVLIPDGSVAQGKLAQAIAFGARLVTIKGSFDDAQSIVKKIGEKNGFAIVNSINPDRILGQSTGAFEIVDALGNAPDIQCMPVGNAGNITAYWSGYKRYLTLGRCQNSPRLFGFQALGAAPIVDGAVVKKPKTVATAIRIGNPASWKAAVIARDESNGDIRAISDDAILVSHRQLAQDEGVFCEPASAISVAGLIEMKDQGFDFTGRTVVCVITGSGLKDIDTALKITANIRVAENSVESVESVLD